MPLIVKVTVHEASGRAVSESWMTPEEYRALALRLDAGQYLNWG